ncbi:hypothetical protein ABVN80_00005 [Acinetobacter baumannii]
MLFIFKVLDLKKIKELVQKLDPEGCHQVLTMMGNSRARRQAQATI